MPPSSSPAPERLNGWKEIAAHVGKGVRTVQRWERQFGFPVHRLGRDGGEIVFALREEVDRWLLGRPAIRGGMEDSNGRSDGADPSMQSDEGWMPIASAASSAAPATTTAAPSPAPTASTRRRRLRPPILVIAAGLLAVLTAVGLLILPRRTAPPASMPAAGQEAPPGPPAVVRATANEIIVLDSNGKEVWRSEVGGRISPGFAKDYKGRFAQVHDLDNDGRREVLVSIRGERNSPANGLMVFNEDGSRRFAYTPDARVRFGSQGYAGPWLGHYFWVVNEGGRTSIWATFTHGTDFPALLVELDLQGKERSRYWSNGYITSVSLLTWRGRRVVVVGAANNEWKGSSLAVFDRDKVVGTAPAANPKYRCTDCGAGLPRSFVVFPGWCIAQAYGGTGLVQELWLDDDGFLHVQIGAGVSMENGEYGATVWYVLRPDLTPASVDIIDYVRRLHDEYYAAGRLDHRFTQADAQRLFPLKIWKDGAYADLPPGKVTW